MLPSVNYVLLCQDGNAELHGEWRGEREREREREECDDQGKEAAIHDFNRRTEERRRRRGAERVTQSKH